MIHAILLPIVLNAAIFTQQTERKASNSRNAVEALKKAAAVRDLDALKKAVDDARENLPPRAFLAEVALEACKALSSTRFDDDEQRRALLQAVAAGAISDGIDASPEYLVPIVMHVRIDFQQEAVNDWAHSRRKNTLLYLSVLSRLSKEIDRGFKFTDEPVLNPVPPGGGYKPGVSPSSIKEPEIRILYEKLLAENDKKRERYDRQLTLRALERKYLPAFEAAILGAYSIDPIDVEQVKNDLDTYGVPGGLIKKVVKHLEARDTAVRTLREAIRKGDESRQGAPATTAIGATPSARTLSLDPRLAARITKSIAKPTVAEITDLLSTSTGLRIVGDPEIPSSRLAFWSISYHNVPAWAVMDELKQSVTYEGSWIGEENGYRLAGDLRPSLESLVQGADGQPGWSPLRKAITLVCVMVVFAAVVIVIHRRRKRKVKK